MTQTLKLKKLENGGYATQDELYQVYNYMGVWTVCFIDETGREDYLDFITLAEAREHIAKEVAA